jgi:hypothetical protein
MALAVSPKGGVSSKKLLTVASLIRVVSHWARTYRSSLELAARLGCGSWDAWYSFNHGRFS